jgi:hypothetical protein
MFRHKAFRSAVCGAFLLASGFAPLTVRANPIQFGANFYDFVFTGLGFTWDEAIAGAASSTFNGVSGHLATIMSIRIQS